MGDSNDDTDERNNGRKEFVGVVVWCVEEIDLTNFLSSGHSTLKLVGNWCSEMLKGENAVSALRIFLNLTDETTTHIKQLELLIGELYKSVEDVTADILFDVLIMTCEVDLRSYPFVKKIVDCNSTDVKLAFFGSDDEIDKVEKEFLDCFGVPPQLRYGNNDEALKTKRAKQNDIGNSIVKHEHVCLGGTFDHLHRGHKLLLTGAALICSNTVHVGVSGDELLTKKKHADMLEPLAVRMGAVKMFFNNVAPHLNTNIFELHDPMGTAATDGALTCIVTSMETQGAISAINEARLGRLLLPLDLHVVPLLTSANDDTPKISSSLIREMLKRKGNDHASNSCV
eukprot:m.125037 g.125037  ORF g.125037 m.125037 type:complete len:341 (-) comp9427_c1_seq8:9044-10066(-)